MSEVNGNGKRESIKVERDGLELEGPARVSRGGYIRVYVKVVSPGPYTPLHCPGPKREAGGVE